MPVSQLVFVTFRFSKSIAIITSSYHVPLRFYLMVIDTHTAVGSIWFNALKMPGAAPCSVFDIKSNSLCYVCVVEC